MTPNKKLTREHKIKDITENGIKKGIKKCFEELSMRIYL